MTVYEALEAVVKESNSPYAKNYAQAALTKGGASDCLIVQDDKSGTMLTSHRPTGRPMAGEELRVQILYMLVHLRYWRGERAKGVRKVLKEAAKE